MPRGALVSAGLALAMLLPAAQPALGQGDGEGLWSLTAPMGTSRAGHTATLLDGPACDRAPRPGWCGKVLVAGGTSGPPGDTGGAPAVRSAELYDPRTGSWAPTGMLNVARSAHTATLLSNGKVLVAGGRATDALGLEIASAELYDPATGSWRTCTSATANSGCPAPMAGERFDHTATRLPNGKVLVAGAATDTVTEPNDPSSELYDPATGRWTATGELTQPRYQHTATLLRTGEVLVTGGTLPPDYGGPEPSETKVSSELYNPATGTWRSCVGGAGSRGCPGDLGQGRYGHTATLLPNGRVLVAGGGDNAGNHTSAEVYDPATGRWTLTKLLNQARYGHSAALLPSGKVLAAGGRGPGFSGALNSTELYDTGRPGTRWSFGGFMWASRGSDFTQPRSVQAVLLSSDSQAFGADAALCGGNCGRVLVVGGLGEGLLESISSAELYTPRPTLAAVSPARGPSDGGARVTITGTGFTHGTRSVTFDGVPARSFRVESYSRITVVTPPHRPEAVQVAVTNAGGTATGWFLFSSLAGCPPTRAARNAMSLTAGNDRGFGTSRADVIFAGAGNDVVDGRAGNDCIDLEAGRDRGKGGSGNDFIQGGPGADVVDGGSGNDSARGGSGNDRLGGSRGRDRLDGGAGRDRISGGSSADRLEGSGGNDRISGGSGRDRIRGGSGNDRISARDRSRDRIVCGAGRDRVRADRIDRVSRSCERVRRRR